MPDFYLKRGDTAEPIVATLKDQNGVVDLTGASLKFIMYYKNGPNAGTEKVNAAATIFDAPNGGVSYAWAATDVDVAALFEAEWEVTFASGDIQTFPNDSYLTILITKDLA